MSKGKGQRTLTRAQQMRKRIFATRDRAEEIIKVELEDGKMWTEEDGTTPMELLVQSMPGALRSQVRRMLVSDCDTPEQVKAMAEDPENSAIMGKGLDVYDLGGEILVQCVKDPQTREAIFTEEDAKLLEDEKDGDVIEWILNHVLRLSGMLKEAETEAGKDS